MSLQQLAFPLARRFVAGESASEALEVVRRLNAEGFTASIDLLGEDVRTTADADRAHRGLLDLIDQVARSDAETNLSLKLSALGLTFEPEATLVRFEGILAAAAASLRDPFVRVDMEGSALVDPTLRIVGSAFGEHPNTGPALQAALHRTPADVDRMNAFGIRVRLCKGAYRELPEIAIQPMAQIRVQYLALALRLLTRGTYPAIATHDPLLIAAVRRVASEHDVAPDRFEFQLLYGCRPDLQRALLAEGYRVRVYVPFGTRWARYFRRRITERRANLFFALRSLVAR